METPEFVVQHSILLTALMLTFAISLVVLCVKKTDKRKKSNVLVAFLAIIFLAAANDFAHTALNASGGRGMLLTLLLLGGGMFVTLLLCGVRSK